MIPSRRIALLGLLWAALLLPVSAVQAQPADLQSPAAFLGYDLGERFTPHHRVVDYLRHVTGASPNVTLQQYGTSYEGRPLFLATVSAPDNLSRVDQIRQDNLRRAGFADGAVQSDTSTALVWLSYNVHGNESVSTEAAMQTLYELADPSNNRTQRWLQNTVVLLDPCLNPDGRERYVQWYNRMVGAQPNPRPIAREHHEPWPGGRANHYYFDLNRDWAWGVQAETQQRLAVYHEWMPHVHVDFHEQSVDAPYYFAPAARPFHENITEWQRQFQFTIGRNNARYFDRNNWLYFTREVFDLFYPGYGDTWPIFNGAIGMTYEQGGSGRAGLAIVTAESDTLTLADRIAHHHTAGLSTVEVTAQNHQRVAQEFAEYYRSGENDPPGEYRTFIVRRDAEGDRLQAFAQHLDRQHIEYGYAASDRDVRGFVYSDGSRERTVVRQGDLVVPASQPKARLVKVLLEPKTTIIDSLTYDITSWSLPYAYGLDAVAMEDALSPDTQTAPARPTGVRGAADAPYAYVTRWTSRADVRFAADLLEADVSIRVGEKPFSVDGQSYDAGTLIITRAGNTALGDRFDALVRETAQAHGQPLHAVATGFVDEGSDFGSANVGFVDAPHVAVLAGEPTSSYSLGEVWHYFDRTIEYPLTLLPADEVDGATLQDVDVLILPEGRYEEWMTDARTSALTDWVRAGGRLIAIGRANGDLAGRAPFNLTLKKNEEDAVTDEKREDTDAALRRYADAERASLTTATPGSIHRTRIDTSHPLGFGVAAPYYTLKRSDEAFAYLGDDGWTVAALETGTPVSGFMGHKAQDRVAETMVAGSESLGRGHVVYLIDNPLFRGFWYSGQHLFSNAVFLLGAE